MPPKGDKPVTTTTNTSAFTQVEPRTVATSTTTTSTNVATSSTATTSTSAPKDEKTIRFFAVSQILTTDRFDNRLYSSANGSQPVLLNGELQSEDRARKVQADLLRKGQTAEIKHVGLLDDILRNEMTLDELGRKFGNKIHSAEVAKLREQLEVSQKNEAQALRDKDAFREASTRASERADALQTQIQPLQEQVRDLQTRLSDLEKVSEAEAAESKGLLISEAQKNVQLQKQLDEQAALLRSATENLDLEKANVEAMQKSMKALQAERDEVDKDRSRYRKERDEARAEKKRGHDDDNEPSDPRKRAKTPAPPQRFFSSIPVATSSTASTSSAPNLTQPSMDVVHGLRERLAAKEAEIRRVDQTLQQLAHDLEQSQGREQELGHNNTALALVVKDQGEKIVAGIDKYARLTERYERLVEQYKELQRTAAPYLASITPRNSATSSSYR